MFCECSYIKVELHKLVHKKEQLVMFLDGPGGSGKSFIMKEVVHYAKHFCQEIAFPFTEMTILVTATSGVVATLIKGETVHRAVYLNRRRDSVTIQNIEAYKRVRLIVVDEISMLGVPLLVTLESTLRQLSQVLDEERPYGGFHMGFFGDFGQLNPIGKKMLL
jgi:ATP-dependent exoDNAse (exonuclease V) alpha subunit